MSALRGAGVKRKDIDDEPGPDDANNDEITIACKRVVRRGVTLRH